MNKTKIWRTALVAALLLSVIGSLTGGTISGSTAGIASFQAGAVVVVDNSESGTPIAINKVDIADEVDYTVKGNPTIG